MTLDRFHDHNRVVHDQPNREHEREQRQGIDREAQEWKCRERPDERHRHGNDRDERRPPILQKEENDDDDENQGLEECLNDLADALGDR